METLKLTRAQLNKIINSGDYESLEVTNGECASDGITYKIDGRLVEIQKDTEWIDIKDQMPPINQEVLCKVVAPFCRYSVLQWDGKDWWRWANPITDVKGWFAAGMEVTHWKLIEE